MVRFEMLMLIKYAGWDMESRISCSYCSIYSPHYQTRQNFYDFTVSSIKNVLNETRQKIAHQFAKNKRIVIEICHHHNYFLWMRIVCMPFLKTICLNRLSWMILIRMICWNFHCCDVRADFCQEKAVSTENKTKTDKFCAIKRI